MPPSRPRSPLPTPGYGQKNSATVCSGARRRSDFSAPLLLSWAVLNRRIAFFLPILLLGLSRFLALDFRRRFFRGGFRLSLESLLGALLLLHRRLFGLLLVSRRLLGFFGLLLHFLLGRLFGRDRLAFSLARLGDFGLLARL